jgi:hypothetical protein
MSTTRETVMANNQFKIGPMARERVRAWKEMLLSMSLKERELSNDFLPMGNLMKRALEAQKDDEITVTIPPELSAHYQKVMNQLCSWINEDQCSDIETMKELVLELDDGAKRSDPEMMRQLLALQSSCKDGEDDEMLAMVKNVMNTPPWERNY